MAMQKCRECQKEVSDEARACPNCGAPFPARQDWRGWGYEWRSEATLFGLPLVHIAFGRDTRGKLRVAKGIIAIGQFAIGAITIAQFGIGVLFGFGQFILGFTAVAQFAGAIYFAAGQFAAAHIAIGQFAWGTYALGQLAIGKHIWTPKHADPQAVEFFKHLAARIGWRVGR